MEKEQKEMTQSLLLKDINEVRSMGFRGEALASIAAIAKIEMKSKTENDEIRK